MSTDSLLTARYRKAILRTRFALLGKDISLLHLRMLGLQKTAGGKRGLQTIRSHIEMKRGQREQLERSIHRVCTGES